MALLTPIPTMGEKVGSTRLRGTDSPRSMSSRTEMMDEPLSQLIQEKIFVAVGKDVTKNKSTLVWALQNTGGKKICIIHVHQPAQTIPFSSTVKKEADSKYKEREMESVHASLDEYVLICQQRGVRAEKMCIEMDSIEMGIVKLISHHGIKKLVMGAAADRHYSKKLAGLMSKKAIFVQREAPSTCHIWFTCNGSLIYTREATIDDDGDDTESEYASPRPSQSDDSFQDLSDGLPDGNLDDVFCDQIREAVASGHQKSENNAAEAVRRAKESEIAYSEELKRRKETEIALMNEKEELEELKKEKEQVREELRRALDRRDVLESQITESNETVEELRQKIVSAVELLQSFKKEEEELQTDREQAMREAEEMRRLRTETSEMKLPQFFTDFAFAEIEEATNHFDSSLKIGEGEYGCIHIGILRHTQVAIKLLNSNNPQSPLKYRHEVDVLSKTRHPNIITLIGACPEALGLVYEFLPNGSLEERLNCHDNSPPLSWQSRVRIAAEICAALIYLHSYKSNRIVHGDLKAENILLDANLISKVSNFGIHGNSREITPKSDVYSFGIILLRLLTGRSDAGIIEEAKYGLESGTLNELVDPLAGDWPFVQAEQLVRLALRCCENLDENLLEVQRVLEPMRASTGSPSVHLGRRPPPPPYFICPIFQEVMQDPHVAADGYTYEAEAIRAWIENGHETSPMTNLALSHTCLVPNHALRSSILEWCQRNW